MWLSFVLSSNFSSNFCPPQLSINRMLIYRRNHRERAYQLPFLVSAHENHVEVWQQKAELVTDIWHRCTSLRRCLFEQNKHQDVRGLDLLIMHEYRAFFFETNLKDLSSEFPNDFLLQEIRTWRRQPNPNLFSDVVLRHFLLSPPRFPYHFRKNSEKTVKKKTPSMSLASDWTLICSMLIIYTHSEGRKKSCSFRHIY